ncbi:MAG TPA: helix-turn-helix transcriptional regulator, partial [Chloroflexota bacterium]|nr:helix-turn-helix transcriptional regulator [Chloroflexota bacterium]
LSGYVPEDYVSAARVVSEEQVVRITQEAIRRISEVARDSLNASADSESISQSGGFDPESLADKLTQRRQLVGLTINQVARRARVPQRQIGDLEGGSFEYEPPELRHILVSGYGLSDQEVSQLIIEMSLHSLLRRQPEVSESQRTMIVDVAIAAMRREATD